jgi:50S ribosomal protein L16 3-hydroxylase
MDGKTDAASTPSFSLGKSFWRAFTKTYWGRKPTIIRAPFPMPIATPDDVFRGLVAVRRRLGEPRDDLDLSIEGSRIVLDLERWLPRGDDASLAGYHARLKRDGAGEQLAMLVNEFQDELGWTFYTRLRQFLHGLYEIAGAPPHAEVDVFLGNYLRTPLGVHRDEADVFCFVVEGKKQFRLWPKEAFRSSSPRYGPGPYTKYMDGSFCLAGDPGDILYWPSSYWHVAESDGRLGSSLTLGLYHGYSVFVALTRSIGEWYREIGGDERDPVGSLPFSNSRVPAELASTAQRAEGRPGRLTERLMRTWMERITGYGFDRIPRPRGRATLEMSRAVRANPISPILHWRYNGDMVIAANGRSIAVTYDNEIVKMLGRVSRGSVCPLAELQKAKRRKPERSAQQALRRTLKFLLEERALEPA